MILIKSRGYMLITSLVIALITAVIIFFIISISAVEYITSNAYERYQHMSYLCEGGIIIGKTKIEEMCKINQRLPQFDEYNDLSFSVWDGEYNLIVKLAGDVDETSGRKTIIIQSRVKYNEKKLTKSMSKVYYLDSFNYLINNLSDGYLPYYFYIIQVGDIRTLWFSS